eukprot:gene25246-1519_t
MLRLAFEAARAYRRLYCPSTKGQPGKWRKLHLRVW